MRISHITKELRDISQKLASDQYVESIEDLDPEDQNMVRALTSLREEIEAISYYYQRSALCDDPELKKIFDHNRKEEIEHALSSLDWIRENDSVWQES
jgi:hypothetical protein